MWSWINCLPHVASSAPVSQCGSRITLKVVLTSKTGTTCELGRDTESWTSPQTCWLRICILSDPQGCIPRTQWSLRNTGFEDFQVARPQVSTVWLHTIYVSLLNINNYQYEQLILGGAPSFLIPSTGPVLLQVAWMSDEVIPGLILNWTNWVLPHSELCSRCYSVRVTTCSLAVWTLRESIWVSVTDWLCLHVGEHEPSGYISPSANSTVVLGIPSQPCGFLMKWAICNQMNHI